MVITKQKFYELCVLKTYQLCLGDEIKKEADVLESLGCDLEHMTFLELKLKRAIVGFNEKLFPEKQSFDKLGFRYLAQVFGFVLSTRDCDFTDSFFSMLKRYPKLIDFSNEDQGEFLLSVYIDSVCGERSDHTFARRLGDFLLRNGQKAKSKWFPRMVSIAYSLGITHEVGLFEIVELRKKFPYEDSDNKRRN